MLDQRFAIAPPVRNEEGRLTIADLFDLADEDVSLLSAIFADVRSQTQLGILIVPGDTSSATQTAPLGQCLEGIDYLFLGSAQIEEGVFRFSEKGSPQVLHLRS